MFKESHVNKDSQCAYVDYDCLQLSTAHMELCRYE